jgi:hypothetical protein
MASKSITFPPSRIFPATGEEDEEEFGGDSSSVSDLLLLLPAGGTGVVIDWRDGSLNRSWFLITVVVAVVRPWFGPTNAYEVPLDKKANKANVETLMTRLLLDGSNVSSSEFESM